MPEQDFTNREIRHFFEEIKGVLNLQNSVLAEIKAQVTKTNGRVSALELWKEGVMAKFAGVAATLGILWIGIKEFILK